MLKAGGWRSPGFQRAQPLNKYPPPFNSKFPLPPLAFPTLPQTTPYMKKITFLPVLFIICTACKKELGLASNSTFSLDKFEQNIIAKYGPQTTGYSYAISQNDAVVRYGAGGKARQGTKDGNVSYTPETRQELASVSKFVTAIAVCKILAAQGKTLNEKVVDYLPTNWKIHASHNNLNFRQLLSHKSGFNMESRSFDSLQKMMTQPRGDTGKNYNNANYALCRVILPYMYFGKNNYQFDELQDLTETSTATDFRIIIREQIMQPAGLQYWNQVDFKDWVHPGGSDIFCRYYLWSDPSEPSTGNSDDYLISGSRGLTLSTYEVAQILTAYEKKQLVNESWIDNMKAQLCGFDGGSNGAHGTYYWKNGGLTSGDGTGCETIIMIFPNGVRVSVNANSNRFKGDSFVSNSDNMVECFDDAWE
jgi:CubicO group peptidase (beta-lactamase class C family)